MRLWLLPSIIILLLISLGPLGANLRVLEPGLGFNLFFLGVALSVVTAVLLAGGAAFAAVSGRAWRRRALAGAVVPILVAVGVIGPNVFTPMKHPIHDITTAIDDDRIQFTPDVAAMRPEAPREDVLAQQESKYPDIEPVYVDSTVPEAWERVVEMAEQMPNWTIEAKDPVRHRLEAVATTDFFHFQDDLVVEVSEDEEEGVRLDMRSRSRVGQSDLGANYQRVLTFLELVEEGL